MPKLQRYFSALKNGPRKLTILVQVPGIQKSNWVKDPSLQDEWFGQDVSRSEGQLGTLRALFFRPAAFDPYMGRFGTGQHFLALNVLKSCGFTGLQLLEYCIWAKSCRMGKKCFEWYNLTLTPRVTLSKKRLKSEKFKKIRPLLL